MIAPRKSPIILLLPSLLPFAMGAEITVNNNPGAIADHTSLAAALAAAQPGDRLILAGSPTSYGNVSIATQDITLIGVGYLRTENGLPADASGNNHPASFGASFVNGTSGTTIVGCDLNFASFSGTVSNTLIDRCRITGFTTLNSDHAIRFTRCYFSSGLNISDSTDCSVIGSIIGSLALRDSSVASHCVIRSTSSSSFPGISATVLGIDATSSASNLIIDLTTSTATNFPPVFSGSITHSITLGNTGLPAGGGNIDNQTRNLVVEAAGTLDAFWRLAPGSPALAAASDGTDIGAFGGPTPYVLSGVPGAPRITRMLVPAIASPTTGLSIEVDIDQDEP